MVTVNKRKEKSWLRGLEREGKGSKTICTVLDVPADVDIFLKFMVYRRSANSPVHRAKNLSVILHYQTLFEPKWRLPMRTPQLTAYKKKEIHNVYWQVPKLLVEFWHTSYIFTNTKWSIPREMETKKQSKWWFGLPCWFWHIYVGNNELSRLLRRSEEKCAAARSQYRFSKRIITQNTAKKEKKKNTNGRGGKHWTILKWSDLNSNHHL